MEEYRGVGRSLQDLVEGQERNIAQLARIGATVEQRWSLRKNLWGNKKKSKEESRDDVEGSKNGTGESQKEIKEETLSSASY